VYGQQRRYIQTLPLHHSQEETEVAEDYSVFSYILSPTFDFKQQILSYGDTVEVLSPDWFREEMKESVGNMYRMY
jgi:predicted DNA-binding transcriptional regulator YafY